MKKLSRMMSYCLIFFFTFLLLTACENDNKLIGTWTHEWIGSGFTSGQSGTSYLIISKNGDNYSITRYGVTNGDKSQEKTTICSFENGCFLSGGFSAGCCYDENKKVMIVHVGDSIYRDYTKAH